MAWAHMHDGQKKADSPIILFICWAVLPHAWVISRLQNSCWVLLAFCQCALYWDCVSMCCTGIVSVCSVLVLCQCGVLDLQCVCMVFCTDIVLVWCSVALCQCGVPYSPHCQVYNMSMDPCSCCVICPLCHRCITCPWTLTAVSWSIYCL